MKTFRNISNFWLVWNVCVRGFLNDGKKFMKTRNHSFFEISGLFFIMNK